MANGFTDMEKKLAQALKKNKVKAQPQNIPEIIAKVGTLQTISESKPIKKKVKAFVNDPELKRMVNRLACTGSQFAGWIK